MVRASWRRSERKGKRSESLEEGPIVFWVVRVSGAKVLRFLGKVLESLTRSKSLEDGQSVLAKVLESGRRSRWAASVSPRKHINTFTATTTTGCS